MNPTVGRALQIGLPVLVLLVGTGVTFTRTRAVYAACWFIGAVCLSIVVLTHVAEGMQWFPVMRWGQQDSPGHYLDLTSAGCGAGLLLIGTLVRLRRLSDTRR